jgi:hypothetical protein
MPCTANVPSRNADFFLVISLVLRASSSATPLFLPAKYIMLAFFMIFVIEGSIAAC